MPQTLNTNALITAEQALTALRSPVGVTVSSDELIDLINGYSTKILRYICRELLPKTPTSDATAVVTRKFPYDGSGYLSLAPYEIRPLNLGAIVLYSDLPVVSQRTLAVASSTVESEYRLEPRNMTPEGTYLWLTLLEANVPRLRAHHGVEVSITGRWGAGVVPADVQLACKKCVAHGFRNPEGFASRNLGELTFSELPTSPDDDAARGMPLEAIDLLADYRRIMPAY